MTVPNDWRRSIPDHWSIVPLKAVATYEVSNVDKHSKEGEKEVRLCNYSDVYHNDFITEEIDFMISTASENEIDRFQLFPDDVIITKDSESWDDIAVPAVITQSIDNLICGYHLAILRSDGERLTGRFLFHCLQSKAVRAHLELEATGITRYGIPKSAIGEVPIPLPPLSAQKQIITYLDRETARIDRLIDAKQRLLSILEEKRRAMVLTAVTRGLDAGVELRDSGVEWLGAVPAHWEMITLKFIADLKSGESITSSDIQPEGNYPVYGGNGLRGFTDMYTHEGYYVLIGRQGALCGNINYANEKFWASEHAVVAELESGFHTLWFGELLRIMNLNQYSVAAAQPGLSVQRISDLRIPVPPKGEQQTIANYIETSGKNFTRIKRKTDRIIQLLQERRAALITAAVTGQIEIP